MKRVHALKASALRHDGGAVCAGRGSSIKDAAGSALSLRFWGVRGSIPVTGPEHRDFGSNTACIEVVAGNHLFVVDAGSGIVPLGKILRDNGTRKIDILLSHLHHDHIMGLFFFKPLYEKDAEVTIYCGNLDGETAEAALRRMFSPPLFPITFEQLPATIRFVGFRAGETLEFEDGTRVRTHLLEHPSGATAYRFEAGGRSAAIVTDVEHRSSGPCDSLAKFVRHADVVVYDAMMCADDYPSCRGWGHSTAMEGVTLCRNAEARRMLAFHHHPAYSDAKLCELDRMLASVMPGSGLAREGQIIALPAQPATDMAEPARKSLVLP